MCSISDLKPECSSCSAKISKCGVLQKCKCHPDKLCLLAFNAILKETVRVKYPSLKVCQTVKSPWQTTDAEEVRHLTFHQWLEASILKSGRGFNNVCRRRCWCKYCVLWPVLLFWFYCPKHCCDGSPSRWQTMWNIQALDFHQGSLRFSHNEGQFIHWHSIYNSVDEATTPVMATLESNLCCHFARFHPIWFLW